jgi:hypothetical protein
MESFCQPVALVHRSVDPSRALNVTSRLGAAGGLPLESKRKETDHGDVSRPICSGAEAVTPETEAAAAARDGFVTYDELRGPDLDAARWSPARLPLPTGGDHIPRWTPTRTWPSARARCE